MELPTNWQDWVLALGQMMFFIALLPSVFSEDKPNIWSSLLSGITLVILAYTFWTLGLLWGAVMTSVGAGTWFVLFFQKLR